ncbi:MAG: hypothetical protein ABI851_12080 [Saprospiraceae bacterium]
MLVKDLPNNGEFKGLRDLVEFRHDPKFLPYYYSKNGLLKFSFSWYKSPEGEFFWDKICNGSMGVFKEKYPNGWAKEMEEPEVQSDTISHLGSRIDTTNYEIKKQAKKIKRLKKDLEYLKDQVLKIAKIMDVKMQSGQY